MAIVTLVSNNNLKSYCTKVQSMFCSFEFMGEDDVRAELVKISFQIKNPSNHTELPSLIIAIQQLAQITHCYIGVRLSEPECLRLIGDTLLLLLLLLLLLPKKTRLG